MAAHQGEDSGRPAARRATANPSLCVVIPCFNEVEALPWLIAELTVFLDKWRGGARALLVDDGSRDATGVILERACAADDRLACLHLSRNFGHQAAITAGLARALGDLVAVMDADLQDPPAVFLEMLERWREGFDVVYGVRTRRKEGLAIRAAYALFYRLLHRVANVDIPLDAGDFALMDRRVVDHLNRLPERQRFVRGLRSWLGFSQVGVPYARMARAAGPSKYNFGKLVKLAMDGLVSFSSLPLRIASVVGAGSAAIAGAYLVYAMVSKVLLRQTPPGWASLVGVFVFLGGVQLLVLGIIGEYLGRVFEEVKQRPTYVIDGISGWLRETEPDPRG